jgi:hypothetical protein
VISSIINIISSRKIMIAKRVMAAVTRSAYSRLWPLDTSLSTLDNSHETIDHRSIDCYASRDERAVCSESTEGEKRAVHTGACRQNGAATLKQEVQLVVSGA